MKPTDYNITIYRGAKFYLAIEVLDAGGSAIDLTGYSARMKAKSSYVSSGSLLSYTTGSEITVTPASGLIEIEVAGATTAGYGFSTAVYDLEIYTAGDAVYRLMQGVLTVSAEVTD